MTGTPRLIVISLALVALVAAGCAKRPAMTQASAPAPTAGTAMTTPPAQAAPPATVQPAPPAPARAAQPSTGPQTTSARPSPKDYVETADLKDVHFDFDKYEIRKADAAILDADAAWLKAHEDQLVMIEGHCDERGTNEYNMALGERRAKATMNYLVSRGVAETRISITSYGEERPSCTEHGEACWAKNRRAHFLIKGK